jgi:hypothetical protein
LNALRQPDNQKIIMRLLGALAFRTHCPQFGYIQDALGRQFTDIDFASYPRFFKDIVRLLTGLGYQEDKTVTQLFSDRRLLFHDPVFGRHIDVFFNQLDFCHPVSFVGRLEADEPTLPLAELLLEKLQIVKLNEKDLIDTIMLLREHPLGDSDRETINVELISRTLGDDWGFWRTVTGNLHLLDELVGQYERLSDQDRQVVRRIQASGSIEKQPDCALENASQDRREVKWYKDVESSCTAKIMGHQPALD